METHISDSYIVSGRLWCKRIRILDTRLGVAPSRQVGFFRSAMKTLSERFRSKIEQGEAGCINWVGFINQDGYGLLGGSGRTDVAHRLAWALYIGKIPAGLCVLHKCDNRRCVNPAHLFLGTRADNARDRDKKQRQARGERQGLSKLTAANVGKIRELLELGTYHNRDLALLFGVSITTIHKIKSRETWKHV